MSELFVRVDAVFGSGDIFAMAKMMSTMRQSLKLVGNVPEFKSGKEKLKASVTCSSTSDVLSVIRYSKEI